MSEQRRARREAQLAARRVQKRRRKSQHLDHALDSAFNTARSAPFGVLLAIAATVRDWWAGKRGYRR